MLPNTSKGLANVLGVLQVFIGLGAVAGGLGLALEPSGARLEIPLKLLEKSPFSSYLIPGIVLLCVNGFGNLLGAVASFKRQPYAGQAAMALGGFLVTWIVLQVYWFAGIHWLHALYFALGLIEFVLGWSLQDARRGSNQMEVRP